jgi:hypothetical protein
MGQLTRADNGPKQNNFLGLFLKVFGWSFFSITVVEPCSRDQLRVRENWYLSTFKPLLNILMVASSDPRVPCVLSFLKNNIKNNIKNIIVEAY